MPLIFKLANSDIIVKVRRKVGKTVHYWEAKDVKSKFTVTHRHKAALLEQLREIGFEREV